MTMQPETRLPTAAGRFYPAGEAACRRALEECRRQAAPPPAKLVGRPLLGGLAPHAGWVYSGPTAWTVFAALAQSARPPETVVLWAACHRGGVPRPALQSSGRWRTPLGEAEIDAECAALLLEAAEAAAETGAGSGLLADDPAAHEGEHAVEVLLPFMQAALPQARFVPVAVPATAPGAELGRVAGRALRSRGRAVAAVCSTDLTHYGMNYYGFAPQGSGRQAHRWAKDENDRPFLQRLEQLDGGGAQKLALQTHAACGPAAAAAACACAVELGAARGVTVEHVTSWERVKEDAGEQPTDFVGYAALLFVGGVE